jgi:hypothetical protein
VVLVVLLFGAFPGVVLGTNSFFFRDFGTLGYPFIHYHRECFWRGELPLWNPLSNCGAPFLAQWNSLAVYPLSLVYLIFPLPWSLNCFCLGHLFLAGLGMYLLARAWVGNVFAAAVAGVAFAFSGLTLASHIYPNYLVALGWMPWVVWLTERAWREGGRMMLLAAGAGAMQMLSGAPELILQTWLVALVLWAGHWVWSRGARLAGFGRLAVVVLLVAGLSAVQLLPFFDLLLHSQRGPGFADQFWTMPGWGWANLLVPLFHCFRTPQGVFFQSGQVFLGSYYLGIGVLALALLALVQVRRRRVWALGALAALSLVLALGENGPLYAWLRRVFPWLGVVRFPIKFVYLAGFVVPVLAAYAVKRLSSTAPGEHRQARASVVRVWVALLALMGGLVWFAQRYPFASDQWPATWQSAVTRALFLTAILGAAVALSVWSGGVRQGLARGGLLVLAWLDVQTHVPHLAPVIANAAYATGVVELKPKPRAGEWRVMISPRAEQLLRTRTLPDFQQDFLGSRLALWSNLNMLEGVPKVNGAATLQLREEAELEAGLYASVSNDFPRLMDFLGVSHVSSPANPVEWVARAGCLPLVTIGQKPLFADRTETLRALFSPSFRPDQVVYLPVEAGASVRATNDAAAKIVSLEFAAQRIEIQAQGPVPTMLVVAQSFYHPWRAYVDEAPVELWRANHAFQALVMPAGRHRVRLAYEDRLLCLGAWISGSTLILILIPVCLRRLRQTRVSLWQPGL